MDCFSLTLFPSPRSGEGRCCGIILNNKFFYFSYLKKLSNAEKPNTNIRSVAGEAEI